MTSGTGVAERPETASAPRSRVFPHVKIRTMPNPVLVASALVERAEEPVPGPRSRVFPQSKVVAMPDLDDLAADLVGARE
ncbi:hypothetical protein BCD49_11935 [Pseudofrankia sp. EUN1h]|nr:hypothetical protein BCD49_11935 [Pseudofrankia sp. EUN1h]